MKFLINFILIYFATPFFLQAQWNQIGSNLEGEDPQGKYFGWATDLNAAGDVLIVGDWQNNEAGDFAGNAQVFEWDGTAWNQRGADIDGNGPDQQCGHTVSIDASGNTIAVTSLIADNSLGLPSGLVRVYDWDGSAWNQRGNDIEGEGNPAFFLDWFGVSLSFSADGNRLAIGGSSNDNVNPNGGHFRVYEWDGNDWAQMGDDIYGEAFDELGFSISMNEAGDIVAVGAIGNLGFGDNQEGYVEVFAWNGSTWNQLGERLSGKRVADEFGRAVALNGQGNVLAVGAPGTDVLTQNDSCEAFVFEWDGTDWNQRGSTLVGNPSGNGFGDALDLNASGNILAVGAPIFFSNGNVTVFEWSGTSWNPTGAPIQGDAPSDIFGSSVNLNANGDILAVGAWGYEEKGQVKIFQNPALVNIQNVDDLELEYFPNPTADGLQIKTIMPIESLKVFDINGKECILIENIQNDSYIDLNTINSGIYFLHIQIENQIKVVKITKI